MNITINSNAGLTVVKLEGHLDAATSASVLERLTKLLQEGQKYQILDFSQVDYMASSGLRVLIAITRQAKSIEGRIILVELSEMVHEVLAITGFLPHLEIYQTVDEAITSLKS